MEVVMTKVVVLLLWAVVKMSSGMLPLLVYCFLSRSRHGKLVDRAVGATLCMGGGVLLATVFIHMLPEVQVTIYYYLLY